MCELVKKIQEIVGRGEIDFPALTEIQGIVKSHIPALQNEICDQDWQPGRYMLYKDPKYGFVVMLLVWGKGDKTPIHAHGTWGVEAVVKNSVRVTNYTYCDKNPKELSSQVLTAGALAYVMPPDEDVHVVAQDGELPAMTIHVYGKELTENIVFSPGLGFRTCPVTCRKVKTNFFDFANWLQASYSALRHGLNEMVSGK